MARKGNKEKVDEKKVYLHKLKSTNFLKRGKRLKIRTRIVGLFLLIVMAAISIAAGITYYMGKSNLENMTQRQLNNSVRFVIDQISLLSGAYTSREFSDKLSYVLTAEEASFTESGLSANIYLINAEGFEVDRSNVNAEGTKKTDLPDEFIAEAFKDHKGITYRKIQNQEYSVAFGYILEKDWLYVVAVSKASYLQPVYKLQQAVAISGIFSILIALLLSLVGTKGIIRTVKQLSSVVSNADKGDMTVRAEEGQGGTELAELANNFNIMISNFQAVLIEISCTIEELTVSSKQLSQIADKTDTGIVHVHNITYKMAEGTENQKQYILQIRDLTEQMTRTITSIANQIEESTRISHVMIEALEEGMQSIGQLENKMNRIEKVSSGTADQIKLLESRSKKINNIVNTIKSISQQTKLLSLNASIEASRAGEFGAGFAVVAYEIQKLAQSSAQSAFEVEQIIKEIHQDTQLVSQIANDAQSISHEGTELVGKTSDTFSMILDKVTQTHEYINTISGKAASMRSNTEVFVSRIEEITQIVSETAACSQEVAAEVENYRSLSGEVSSNSSQLLSLASRLDQLNSRFTV